MMNIVLFNPEIPQNTGNIARTCAATGATLHLIEPLGFSLSDKYLKRAGLDYWNLMTYHTYPDFGEFLRQHPDARMHFASTKAPRGYHEATYQDGDFLIFGCETRGLPENLLEYRQDFDKQDHDHGGHHHQHQQRIGDCTADRFGNFQFLFIVAGKAF